MKPIFRGGLITHFFGGLFKKYKQEELVSHFTVKKNSLFLL
jgi:hypothetical protein